jgi:hypothetical protein
MRIKEDFMEKALLVAVVFWSFFLIAIGVGWWWVIKKGKNK